MVIVSANITLYDLYKRQKMSVNFRYTLVPTVIEHGINNPHFSLPRVTLCTRLRNICTGDTLGKWVVELFGSFSEPATLPSCCTFHQQILINLSFLMRYRWPKLGCFCLYIKAHYYRLKCRYFLFI